MNICYSGIDLHSNNNVIGVVDQAGKVLFLRRLPNDIATVIKVLEPYRDQLQGVVVESTFNWYWLVDGLEDTGFNVTLANPAAIKHRSDYRSDDPAGDR